MRTWISQLQGIERGHAGQRCHFERRPNEHRQQDRRCQDRYLAGQGADGDQDGPIPYGDYIITKSATVTVQPAATTLTGTSSDGGLPCWEWVLIVLGAVPYLILRRRHQPEPESTDRRWSERDLVGWGRARDCLGLMVWVVVSVCVADVPAGTFWVRFVDALDAPLAAAGRLAVVVVAPGVRFGRVARGSRPAR